MYAHCSCAASIVILLQVMAVEGFISLLPMVIMFVPYVHCFQVYYAQFDAYVDAPDGHVFCDESKIRLISNEAIPCTCRCVTKLRSFRQTVKLTDFLVVFSTNETLVITPGLGLSSSSESGYRLPPLPLDLQVAIGDTEARKVSSRTISRIVSWLSNHLITISV